eukprot:14707891-Alexandrium_andersonii.AAC.1
MPAAYNVTVRAHAGLPHANICNATLVWSRMYFALRMASNSCCHGPPSNQLPSSLLVSSS